MFQFGARPVEPRTRGSRSSVEGPASAVVVGGGLGGVAAATVLAERGVEVTLVERERFLGGRAGGWTDQLETGETFEMERGFHAFFRQYYNLRSLLRRVDPPLRHLDPLEDYPIFGPGGPAETFKGVPKLPPFNMVEIVRRSPRLHLSDMPKLNGPAALEMLGYDPERVPRQYDSISAEEYLDSLRFPPDARKVLFDVFAHSFFNPQDGMSAADMMAMFHFYFTGNPEGLVFDVACEPLSLALWEPLKRYLEGLGVTIVLGVPAKAISRTSGGGFAVTVGRRKKPVLGDVAVLAVEVPALKRLVAASPDLASLSHLVSPLDVTLPFVVWRLWLDRQPNPDQPRFLGASGLGELDLACLYEGLEGESRRWSMKTGGSVVELHAYAAPEEMSDEALREDLLTNFHEVMPEMREAVVLDERYLNRRDCPAFPPGSWSTRPGVETPVDGLALAGDYLRLPFPSALMERATASGFMAANHLMERWDVRPEPLWSVPTRGLTASFYK